MGDCVWVTVCLTGCVTSCVMFVGVSVCECLGVTVGGCDGVGGMMSMVTVYE